MSFNFLGNWGGGGGFGLNSNVDAGSLSASYQLPQNTIGLTGAQPQNPFQVNGPTFQPAPGSYQLAGNGNPFEARAVDTMSYAAPQGTNWQQTAGKVATAADKLGGLLSEPGRQQPQAGMSLGGGGGFASAGPAPSAGIPSIGGGGGNVGGPGRPLQVEQYMTPSLIAKRRGR